MHYQGAELLLALQKDNGISGSGCHAREGPKISSTLDVLHKVQNI